MADSLEEGGHSAVVAAAAAPEAVATSASAAASAATHGGGGDGGGHGGGGEAVEVTTSTTLALRGLLALENDGSKFFDALGHMGTEALQLSAEDVAGGLKESAKMFADKSAANWAFVKENAVKVDVKNGWAPFAASATTADSKAMLVKAPAAGAFVCLAAVLYVCFGVFFATTKYGPTALAAIKEKASAGVVVLQASATQVNENAIVPMKAKLRPIIADAKAKLDQAISERKAAFSQGTEEAKAMSPMVSPEEDEA